MSGFGDLDDSDLAGGELFVLQAMYEEGKELLDVIETASSLSYKLSFSVEEEDGLASTPLVIVVNIDRGAYGNRVLASHQLFSLQVPSLKSSVLEGVLESVRAELDEDDDEQSMRILSAIEIIKEAVIAATKEVTEVVVAASGALSFSDRRKKHSSFTREWCSFVSLYKESYCSGPDRFTVIKNLATSRGLDITGIAIAGKPGGLVVEGREDQVEEFMLLMRTEFFETLNPRGRKLTTRWQERFPYDTEVERFECAEAITNLKKDLSGKKRLQLFSDRDADIVKKFGRNLEDDEVEMLIAAGPPTNGGDGKDHCAVYKKLDEVSEFRVGSVRFGSVLDSGVLAVVCRLRNSLAVGFSVVRC